MEAGRPTTPWFPRRPALASGAALVAASAFAGAVGLGPGADPYTRHLKNRLPFQSPLFGAVALTTVVAIPYALLVRLAWTGDNRTDVASLTSGAMLMAWIAVGRATVREPSFVNPLFVSIGAAFVVAGRRALLPAPTANQSQMIAHF